MLIGHESLKLSFSKLFWILVSLVLALVLFFALAMFTGCSKSSNETTELLIKIPRTSHESLSDPDIKTIDEAISKMADSFEQEYEKSDVDITIEVFEQDQYDEAILNKLYTEGSPDIVYGDYFNISTYVHTGKVVPLDDIITDEIKSSIFKELWDDSTFENRVYMMPYLSRQNVLAYNKELFREAGLERYIDDSKIQSWTYDEWTEILDTLANNLPDSVYPMLMYAANSQGDTHIRTLLRVAGSNLFDETGKFNLDTPEGIEALRWIQDGVAKGWYPPHAENLQIEDCSRLFKNSQLAIYMLNNVSVGKYWDNVGLVNFPSKDGNGYATEFVSGFQIFDNGDQNKIDIAKDFLSYIYSNDELLSYSAGVLPASKKVSEQYRDEIVGFDMFDDNRDNVVDFNGNNPNTLAVREVFYTCIHDLLMGRTTPEETAKLIDTKCNAIIDDGLASSSLHP